MQTTRTPVAAGSSVPAWPALSAPSARRTRFTTSKLVGPAGLSTTRTPPVIRVSWSRERERARARILRDRARPRARDSRLRVLVAPGIRGERLALGAGLLEEPLDPIAALHRRVVHEPEVRRVAELEISDRKS